MVILCTLSCDDIASWLSGHTEDKKLLCKRKFGRRPLSG